MSVAPANSGRGWLVAALLVTVVKLWLVSAQQVYALAAAGHDDLLFIRLADHVARGEWLGPYHPLTLAKGPFYSLWIAAMHHLHVPLFFSQQLLYAAACAAVALALRPRLRAPALCAIYVLLLANPMSFDASSLGRVLRQHVYTPLVLLQLAALAALYCRADAPARRRVGWAVVLGLAAGAAYLTREESIVFLPSLALLGGAVLWAAHRVSRRALGSMAAALALAAGVAGLGVATVAGLNARHYGWFGTVEFRAPEFKAAYGALLRIQAGPVIPYVPVTREARELAYAVSPTFAELRPHLEGSLGEGWADASSAVTGRPAHELQMGGGWFMWALRDAVAAAGHGGTAAEALAFYSRMASELDAAVGRGDLPVGPPRSGFVPPLRPGQAREVLANWFDFARFTAGFREFRAAAPPSEGNDEQLELFRRMTGESLAPTADGAGGPSPALDRVRVRLLDLLGRIAGMSFGALIVLAHAIAAGRALALLVRRRWSFPLTLAAAAWGAAAAYLLAQAVVHVTSFPVLVIASFAAVYPLWLLFVAAIAWDALAAGAPAWARWREQFPGTAASTLPAELPAAVARWHRPAAFAAGLAAVLPVLVWHREFATLFWFADDLFLVDQIAQMGFGRWVFAFFTESFVPLFKLAWGGTLLAFAGSYQAMIWALWLTHAVNVALFGRILLRAGFGPGPVALTLVVFAWTPANLETLGWSVQWSALLATTFLLLGLWWRGRWPEPGSRWSWRADFPLVLAAAASACCFARGVLTGVILALAILLPAVLRRDFATWARRAPAGLLCLLPAIAVALGIVLWAEGNPRQMAGHWFDAARFGLTFFLLNPGHLLLAEPAPWSFGSLLIAGAKLALVTTALWRSRGHRRVLLVLLLAYDLGNAVLLGIGRHHTGTFAALGSRYQYGSLLATLPFVGAVVADLWGRLPAGRARVAVAAVALLAAGVLCLRAWQEPLRSFAAWRGHEMRQLMAAPYTTEPGATVPALDFMHVERAKALQRAYELH